MILSNRLVQVMHEVVTSGQLCTVRGRSIHNGTHNLMSAKMYLCRVLAAMGFGEVFIKWVTMLHRDASTQFILNFLTRPVKILISLRQGDPLSMILFILYVEPLLLMIRRSTGGLSVLGLNVYTRGVERHELFTGRGEQCVLQADEDYVDDINTIVGDPQDMVKIDSIFEEFEQMSGAILNRSPA